MPAPNQHLITHLNRVEFLYLVILSFGLIALTWFGFENLDWIIGYAAVLGLLTPLLFKSHLEASEFLHYHPWRNWFKVIWPVLVLVLIYVVSLFSPVSEEIRIGGKPYTVLQAGADSWMPVQVDWSSSFTTYSGFVGMFLLSSLLLFIPRTKLFFQRLMEVVFVNNFFICCIYVISSIFESTGIFNFLPVNNPSSFTDTDAWTGYIILWILLSWGFFLSKFKVRRQDHTLLDNPRTILPVTILAVASVIYNMSAWQAVCLFGGLAMALWHYAGLLKRTSKRKGPKHNLGWMITYGLTFACVAGIIWSSVLIAFVSGKDSETISLIPEANMEASLRMISERPLSGWGMESFQKVGSFFAEPDSAPITHPKSDLLAYFIQFGIIGLLLIAWTPLSQIYKYFRKRSRASVTDYALLAVLVATIFGASAMPTAHFGYVYLWLIALFSGIRWADINYEEALREEKYKSNVRVYTPAPFPKRQLSTSS